MNIYLEHCYKKALTKYLLFRKKLRASYTFEAMAQTCGVQKTYLSKVLKHDGNLNLDQLFTACEYLKLKPLESEFLLSLYHYQTAQNSKRRELYKQKIDEIRLKSQATDSKISFKNEKTMQDSIMEYYADPYFSLVHMFLTIEVYSKNPEAMQSALQLDAKKVAYYLDRLESMGIIKQEGIYWKVVQDTLHLPEGSPFVKAHRTLLRLKSLDQLERLSSKDYYSFSVVFSSDESVRREIQERFFQFLEGVKKLVEKGNEKEVYQLNFDLLKWSHH